MINARYHSAIFTEKFFDICPRKVIRMLSDRRRHRLYAQQNWGGVMSRKNRSPWLLSVAIHGALVGIALIPWAASPMIHPKSDGTAVVLFSPAMQLPARSVGGGGGGNHSPLPASRGELPRFDEKQFVPPAAEPPKT